MQWWYGHNAVAFFLTTPYLGLMYYFMPKAAERPVYSYKLSIIHFWALIFLYIWAGPHHLLYNLTSGLGAVARRSLLRNADCSVLGGMINGLLTLRGAWDRVREIPQVHGRGRYRVWYVHLRGTDAVDEERQRDLALYRLDHCARASARRLERDVDLRHPCAG